MVNAAPPEAAASRIERTTHLVISTLLIQLFIIYFTPCWRRTEHGWFSEPSNEELAVTVEPYGRPAIYVYLI